MGWLWGSTLRPLPLVHDEAAYLLQARLFAGGAWTAPGAPLPEFFEQFHVLVTPVIAAKYPPGHSLLLVPGLWLGIPALIPILLSGAAGTLVFALARRLINPAIGLLTWAIWMGASGNLEWRPTYYSEVTTSALGLAAWWGVLRWREGGRGWLLLAAACTGWGAITRPLTMLAFALPIAAVVLRTAAIRRRWGDLAWGAAVGVVILGIMPLWSARTTGDWRKTPLALYRITYMPWDRLGFGLDSTSGKRSLPADMEPLAAEFRSLHAQYTPAAAPALLRRRALDIAASAWNLRRLPLGFVALAGLLFLPGEATIAIVTAGFLFLGYAGYAHKPGWTLYYLEILPVAAFLTALGAWGLAGYLLPDAKGLMTGVPPAWRRSALALLLAPVFLGLAIQDGSSIRRWRMGRASGQLAVQRAVESLPAGKATVFVRYAESHDVHDSYVRNEPFLDGAQVWLVHDLGVRNAELIRRAPDRVPFLLDEATGRLIPLAP